MPSITTLMRKAKIRRAGHITRLPDDRIPKQLLYGELCQGKRSVGNQHKRFKDNLKVSLIDFSIDIQTWENLATDRPTGHNLIHSGAHAADKTKRNAAEKKREKHKARASSNQQTTPIYMCPTCGRGCRSRIGLISHLRTHQTNPRNS